MGRGFSTDWARTRIPLKWILKSELRRISSSMFLVFASLYAATSYYASMRVIDEDYATLSGVGILLSRSAFRRTSLLTSPTASEYTPHSLTAELPVTPLQIYGIAWLVSTLIAAILSLLNMALLTALMNTVSPLPVNPSPTLLSLLVLASTCTSLYWATMLLAQVHAQDLAVSFIVKLLGSKSRRERLALVMRLAGSIVRLIVNLVSLSSPVYFTLSSMP